MVLSFPYSPVHKVTLKPLNRMLHPALDPSLTFGVRCVILGVMEPPVTNRKATAKPVRCPSCRGWGAGKLMYGRTVSRRIPHGQLVLMADLERPYRPVAWWSVCRDCGGTGNVVDAVTRKLADTPMPRELRIVHHRRVYWLVRQTK